MVPVMQLWLPILLSAVAVFVLSSLIHMVVGWHRKDFAKLANETAVMDAVRPLNIPPGEYLVPSSGGAADMKNPEFLEKRRRGPVLMMTVFQPGDPKMGRELSLWFVYNVVVAIFAAYIAGRALAPGAHYLEAFRFAGATTFIAYALGAWQQTIWYKRAVKTTLIANLDALIYAVFTGGIFGWLWPM